MTDFEAPLISGRECSSFLQSIARFLDTSRTFGCDHLLVTRHGRTNVLTGTLDLTTTERRLYLSQQPTHYVFPEGDIVCSYIKAEKKPAEDRPLASTAVKALGSIANNFPADLAITSANAYYLDHTSVVAPNLTINCIAETAVFDRFLSQVQPRLDGAGTPHVLTRYANYHNAPIEVQVYFQEYPLIS